MRGLLNQANAQHKCRSDYAFILAGGTIAYRSKTQSLTATSSCETEFYATVTAAKVAKYLRSILLELGFPQKSPTVLQLNQILAITVIWLDKVKECHGRYSSIFLVGCQVGLYVNWLQTLHEDNASSTIKLINTKQSTEQSHHVDIQFFAIQDWKSQGHILMVHIPGIINPSGDLTKPLGWVLHSHHACHIMGHFSPPWCTWPIGTSPLTMNWLHRFPGSVTHL